jgi:pilus assembly protein CpaC
MNQQLVSVLRRSPRIAFLLLGQLFLGSLAARGQVPVVIPPGAATPSPAVGQATAAGPTTAAGPAMALGQAGDSTPAGPYYQVKGIDDHLKMVVNTSRFITLDRKIPQVQVNNPDVLDVVPISPNQVQVSAKRTGVTQVNLWSEDKRVFTVTVVVVGDAAELTQVLRELFPKTTLTIMPVNGNSVIISGYVDQQDAVPKIVSVATKYFPDVINNMTVSGVQQVVLHVKLMEVSRTKLRKMGFDFVKITNGNLFHSGGNGLVTTTVDPTTGLASVTAPDNVFKFMVGSGGQNPFVGVLEALRDDQLAKILSEPDLVTISGRPAYVLVGGEIGYQVTNALSGTMVGFKEYGTRLDFVPIVLGNGRIHLDVRPRVSQIDAATSVNQIPSIKTRETETGVELRAGQTLAIAGLLERIDEATNSGYPLLSDIPYLGALFRTVSHQTNEVELLVMVTPEIVDGMQPSQVPACLPGMQTTSPSDWELFFKGHLEVPNCCPDGAVACQNNAASGVRGSFSPGEGPISRQNPQNRSAANQMAMNPPATEPGFIGPVGYDVLK